MSPMSRPEIGSSAIGSGGTGRGSETGVGGAGGRFASGAGVATGGGVGRAMGGAGFLQPARRREHQHRHEEERLSVHRHLG